MTDLHLCRSCRRRRWEHVVFVEHDADGRPTGPFMELCTPCLVAEQDGATDVRAVAK